MRESYKEEEFIPPRQLVLDLALHLTFQTGAVQIFERFGLNARKCEALARQMFRLAAGSHDERFEGQVPRLLSGRFDEDTLRRLAALGNRLLLIESLCGDLGRDSETEPTLSFSARMQFLYTSFFNWFYNWILHSLGRCSVQLCASSLM